MSVKPVSLINKIKKVITYRIFICFLVLAVTIFSFFTYDIINSFYLLNNKIKNESSDIRIFIISQVLINNEPAIQAKLDEANGQDPTLHFSWIKENLISFPNVIKWKPLVGWEYYFPVNLSDGTKLGYLKINGSFFSDNDIFYQFIARLILLVAFSFFMFLLLFPLSKKIPRVLFLEPINHFLNLFSRKGEGEKLSQPLPIELKDLEQKIIGLIEENREAERSKILVDMGKLATQVAHDIRSPLTALNSIINDLPYIPEEQRIILRNASIRINDIANNLLTKYRKKDNEFMSDLSVSLIEPIIETMVSEKRLSSESRLITLETTISQSAYFVFANIGLQDFKRVLSNLINNAMEAFSEGTAGRITVDLDTDGEKIIIKIIYPTDIKMRNLNRRMSESYQ
jgi:signal transduction histidine kinase